MGISVVQGGSSAQEDGTGAMADATGDGTGVLMMACSAFPAAPSRNTSHRTAYTATAATMSVTVRLTQLGHSQRTDGVSGRTTRTRRMHGGGPRPTYPASAGGSPGSGFTNPNADMCAVC